MGIVGGLVFIAALIAFVLVPRQATRAAVNVTARLEERPDSMRTVAIRNRAAAGLAAADSALALARRITAPSVVAAGKLVSREQKASTTATMKRQVSTKFVLLILGGVLVIGGVIVGLLLRQKSSIATVATVAPVEDELAKETAERRTLLTDGERFLKEGKSEEALKNFRELVRRSPGSAPAREALARAEALAVIQQESAGKARQVEEHLAAAREASLVPDDAKAISESDFALAIDPANTEAQTLKAAALERLSKKTLADQKKIKDELAARKKAKAKPVATAAPAVVAAAPRPAPEPAGAPSPTPAVANVRIAFQSPISRGLLMIGLNDKIVFRKDFDFGKNGSGGVVDGSVSLRSGPGMGRGSARLPAASFASLRMTAASVEGALKGLSYFGTGKVPSR